MAGLEDTFRSAAPGGNIGKPLMLALLALLASGTLFGGGGAGSPASKGAQPSSDEGPGGLLGGLGGLLGKLQKGGLGLVANSWVGPGQNQPVSPNQLGPALGPNIIKALAQRPGMSEEELTRQLSQVLPGTRRQAHPQWSRSNIGRTIRHAVKPARTALVLPMTIALTCQGII